MILCKKGNAILDLYLYMVTHKGAILNYCTLLSSNAETGRAAQGEKKSGPYSLSLATLTSKLAPDRLSGVDGLGILGDRVGKGERWLDAETGRAAQGEKKLGPCSPSLATSTSKLAPDRLSGVDGLGILGDWVGKGEYPDELRKLRGRGSIMWGQRALSLGDWARGDILLPRDRSKSAASAWLGVGVRYFEGGGGPVQLSSHSVHMLLPLPLGTGKAITS